MQASASCGATLAATRAEQSSKAPQRLDVRFVAVQESQAQPGSQPARQPASPASQPACHQQPASPATTHGRVARANLSPLTLRVQLQYEYGSYM